MHRTILWSASLMVVVIAILSLSAAEHTKDSLDMVKKAIADQQAVLVDVRETIEWDDGHLKDAKSLPLTDLKAGIKADDLARLIPKGKVVYTHCAYGSRSIGAADLLKKQGYDVRPLKAGYDDLLKAGFPKAP